jgi:type VI secretion system protein ImpA
MIDLERLLAPIPDGPPAGPDLDRIHDTEFMALEAAASGKSEQQFGKTIVPAVEPDWLSVRNKSEALLLRTKDLRVALLLARALTRLENIEGLAVGLRLVREILSRYWESLHPALEDGNDATLRLYALAALAHQQTFLQDVRNACFIASPQLGRVLVRDVLVAEGKLPPSNGNALTQAQLDGALRDAAANQTASLRAAIDGLESARALERLLNDRGVLTHEAAPDLRVLQELLQPAAALSTRALKGETRIPQELEERRESVLHVEERNHTETPKTMAAQGEINSREDVVRILDRVCEYMERTEPSSPAPLLIRRAQRLVSRSFIEIIQDLAPDSLSEIRKLAGAEERKP